MNLRIRIFNGVGPIKLLVEDQEDPLRRTMVDFTIPDELLDELIVEAIRRRWHNLGPEALEAIRLVAKESK